MISFTKDIVQKIIVQVIISVKERIEFPQE